MFNINIYSTFIDYHPHAWICIVFPCICDSIASFMCEFAHATSSHLPQSFANQTLIRENKFCHVPKLCEQSNTKIYWLCEYIQQNNWITCGESPAYEQNIHILTRITYTYISSRESDDVVCSIQIHTFS